MEYLDIVDRNGEPTDVRKNKDEVHEKGLLHRHVHVWILNSNGEVLLQKRSSNKKTYPNMWAMSAEGHVSAGEAPEDTVVREVKEELGIDLERGDLRADFSFARGMVKFENGWIENGINTVYFIENDVPLKKIKIQKSEVAEVKWVLLKDYKRMIENENPEYRVYSHEFPKLWQRIKL